MGSSVADSAECLAIDTTLGKWVVNGVLYLGICFFGGVKGGGGISLFLRIASGYQCACGAMRHFMGKLL